MIQITFIFIVVFSLLQNIIVLSNSYDSLYVSEIVDVRENVFKNLQACYECEFAPITKTHMLSDGSYDQANISSHWSSHYTIHMLYTGNTPAGFCVVNHESMISCEQHVHDIGEFYITPIFRKLGYGTWFAKYIFAKYPGTWEVRQLPELAETARKFWISVIKDIKHSNYQEFHNHPQWNGYVQHFDVQRST